MKYASLSSAVFLISLLFYVNSSIGATITVDCNGAGDYLTIQDGIDAAVDGDTVVVSPCTYTGSGNHSIEFDGKAIVVMSSDGPEVTIIDCQGGYRGFYFDQNATSASVLDGFTIQNGSETDGGGIKCSNADPTIRNCIITACFSYRDGGGIHLLNVSPTIVNCTIEGNTASEDGGGIYVEGGSTVIDNCTITGNNSDSGGGIYLRYAVPTITNCTITDNSADNFDGGGIYAYGSRPDITDCTFEGNSADDDGGGIWIGFASGSFGPTVSSCTFKDNSANGKGGGIHYDNILPQYAYAFIWGCRFIGNICESGGGGIYFNDSKVSIYNCLFDSNVTNVAFREGGGIYAYQCDDFLIYNCTLVYNDAWTGGGVYSHYSNTTIYNCILYWNIASIGSSIYYWPDSPTVTYSNIEGGWTGTGNIDTDPQFAEEIDFHLDASSLCVDAGDPSIFDGSHPPGLGGTRSDMGAYGGSENGNWLEGAFDLFLYPTGPTTVTVGDTVFFDSMFWNSTDNSASGDYWLSVVLPNSNEILLPEFVLNHPNPWHGSTPAHSTTTLSNELRALLPGTFEVVARIGVYPNLVVDEESFEVEISP